MINLRNKAVSAVSQYDNGVAELLRLLDKMTTQEWLQIVPQRQLHKTGAQDW